MTFPNFIPQFTQEAELRAGSFDVFFEGCHAHQSGRDEMGRILEHRFYARAMCSLEQRHFFVSSPLMLTSTNALIIRPCCSSRRDSSCAISIESIECIHSINDAMYFALFDCRWPMKCQRISEGNASRFFRSSCTRLSPKSRMPNS